MYAQYHVMFNRYPMCTFALEFDYKCDMEFVIYYHSPQYKINNNILHFP